MFKAINMWKKCIMFSFLWQKFWQQVWKIVLVSWYANSKENDSNTRSLLEALPRLISCAVGNHMRAIKDLWLARKTWHAVTAKPLLTHHQSRQLCACQKSNNDQPAEECIFEVMVWQWAIVAGCLVLNSCYLTTLLCSRTVINCGLQERFNTVIFNLFCTATHYTNQLQPNYPHLKLE